MAVISRIRKHSGWLVALIGIAIAGFILQDAFVGGRQNSIPKFAEVNGEEIKLAQFEQRVEEVSENYRRAQGDMNLSNEDLYQIRQMVWQTMVNDILLYQSCEKLGIKVTSKEVNDMFYGQFIHHDMYRFFPSDPNTGQINRQQIMMVINNFEELSFDEQKQLTAIEKHIKEDRLKTKYYNILASAYYVPAFYADYMYEKTNASLSALVASIDYSTIQDDDVTLSDADFKKYFDKNKALFKREASRAVDFIIFDVKPTDADLAELDKVANEFYEELKTETNLKDFVNAVSSERIDTSFLKKEELSAPWDSILFNAKEGATFEPIVRRNRYEMAKLLHIENRPDSLRASHILLTYQGSAANQGATRTKEAAEATADSLYREILRNKARFAEIAMSVSEDGSRDNGGDLGWFLDGMMVPEFNEACINAKVGDVVVVETVFGYHIIQLTGKTAPIRKVSAAFVYVPIEPSSKTTKEVYTQVNQIFSQCTDHATMLTVASNNGLYVRQGEYVQEMDASLPGLYNAREIVRWAYNSRTKAGSVASEIFDYENQYVIASLRQIRNEGYPSIEELKAIPEVEFTVRNGKKAVTLMAQMNNELAASKSLDALTSADVETVDEVMLGSFSLGENSYEPAIIGSLFGMKENEISKALEGRSGVFAVQQLEYRKPQELEASDKEIIRSQLVSVFHRGLVENSRNAFEKGAKIKENRSFYF